MSREKIYAWGVAGVAVFMIVALWIIEDDPLPPVSELLFWVVLLAIVELLPVSMGLGSEATMSFPIYFALAMVFRHQPWIPMFITAIGSFDLREIRSEIPMYRAAFNRGQQSIGAGVVAMFLAATMPGELNLGPIVAAAVISYGLNVVMVSLAISIADNHSLLRVLPKLFPKPVGGFVLSFALLTALGVVTAVAYEQLDYGALAVGAFFIPILFARLSIVGAQKQQQLSERVQEQQQALLAATERVFMERELERKRIAEDIHDSSLQMLAAASYGSSNALAYLKAGNTEKARTALTTTEDAVHQAMAALRQSLTQLRKTSIEEGGLMETIRQFVGQVTTLWGADIRIEGQVVTEPPTSVALAAFQILQEALTNALKHAGEKPIVVHISESDGMVHLVVEDQGKGFDTSEEVGQEHLGMRLMRERAERVGGYIDLASRPGSGTRLEAVLPGSVA